MPTHSEQPVLIAAYAARALANAARRAGYLPLVADVFADDDTRAAAARYRNIDGGFEKGIRAKSLLHALDALRDASATQPIGLVLGSGFEDKPALMRKLDARYRLIGATPETVAELKQPIRFANLLTRLAIPHPETRETPPDDLAGWLSKLSGGTGGGHIHAASDADRKRRRRYFQRHLPGDSYSVLIAAGETAEPIGFSRQWTAPMPTPSPSRNVLTQRPSPYRYGGAVTVVDPPCAGAMLDAARAVSAATHLAGLAAFDFRLSDGIAYLIEVNPRPGATMDIFDRGDCKLFEAHVRAARKEPLPRMQPTGSAASAILYARDFALTMPRLDWPDWTADRTPAGTAIAAHQAIATVKADAPSTDAAIQLVNARLAQLEDLLYESPTFG